MKKLALAIRMIALVSVVLLLGSCGYKLQGKADLPFDSIALGSLVNESPEPKIEDRFQRRLAEAFLHYGFEVRRAAPYRIDGKITRFEMYPVSEKALVAVEYRIVINGNFTLTDTRTGQAQVLMSVKSAFATYFRASDNLQSVLAQKELASETAVKELSDELVRRVVYRQYEPAKVEKQPEREKVPDRFPSAPMDMELE